ncbi:hypothetical protein IWQ61_001417 [Dispira simplex]|nr:hypothetical protein IWQ61_001417 [Dispira simplex]
MELVWTGATNVSQRFPAYNFFADQRISGTVLPYIGQAVRLQTQGRCDLTFSVLSPPELNQSDSTPVHGVGYLSWSDADAAGCTSYAQLDDVSANLYNFTNITLGAFVLASPISQTRHFGALESDPYGYYLPESSPRISLWLTSYEAGQTLDKAFGKVSTWLPLELSPDRGPWNRLLTSVGYKAQRWLFFTLHLIIAIWTTYRGGRLFYDMRGRFNLILTAYIVYLFYLICQLVVPLQGYRTPTTCCLHLVALGLVLLVMGIFFTRWARTLHQLQPSVAWWLYQGIVGLILFLTGATLILVMVSYRPGVLSRLLALIGFQLVLYGVLPVLLAKLILFAVASALVFRRPAFFTTLAGGQYALRQFTIVTIGLTVSWVFLGIAQILVWETATKPTTTTYMLQNLMYYLGSLGPVVLTVVDLSMREHGDTTTIASNLSARSSIINPASQSMVSLTRPPSDYSLHSSAEVKYNGRRFRFTRPNNLSLPTIPPPARLFRYGLASRDRSRHQRLQSVGELVIPSPRISPLHSQSAASDTMVIDPHLVISPCKVSLPTSS